MSLDEFAAVFGALAAFLALGSMIAHATLGKYMNSLNRLMVVMQWTLAFLSLAAAVVAIWSLVGDLQASISVVVSFSLLGLGGVVLALLFVLYRDRAQRPARRRRT